MFATLIARAAAVNLMPLVWAGLAAAILTVVVFLVDAIGDRREAQVWARINGAIEKTNVDVRRFNDLDDKIAAVQYETRLKALAEAKAKAAQEGTCPASQATADSLTKIR